MEGGCPGDDQTIPKRIDRPITPTLIKVLKLLTVVPRLPRSTGAGFATVHLFYGCDATRKKEIKYNADFSGRIIRCEVNYLQIYACTLILVLILSIFSTFSLSPTIL